MSGCGDGGGSMFTAIERFDIQSRIFILHHTLIRLCCLACLCSLHPIPPTYPNMIRIGKAVACVSAQGKLSNQYLCAASVIFRVTTFILNSLTCIQEQVIWRMVNSLEISISSSGASMIYVCARKHTCRAQFERKKL